jgi:inosose dehydratase
MSPTTRRRFLQTAAATAVAAPLVGRSAAWAAEPKLYIACNQFCWINMYGREGKNFNADLDAGLAEVKRSGMDGLEATLADAAGAEAMVPLLKKHNLGMRSLYTGATLHDSAKVDAEIERVVATATAAKREIDLRVVVVNPASVHGQAKSDAQLKIQADAMTQLGGRLAKIGIALAYHFHAPAWKDDGREFYHVMNETDPKLVQLCLDTHWVYRGSGNHAQKVYDVVRQYGTRVAELHLRQSKDGVWTECMCEGDIDDRRVAAGLKARGVKPLLVVEQAVEQGTPNTMDAVESHRRSRAYVEQVFSVLFE